MHIRIFATALSITLALVNPAQADDIHKHEHGGEIFHMFRLEADSEIGSHYPKASWDLEGWIGSDNHKLWLKSEGELEDGHAEQSEFWGLYSKNIAAFWDAQLGLRHDTQPESTTYLVGGFNGLAKYFFETEAHLFISEDGDVSARLHQENEFLVTQRLIIQPYLELNLFAQDVEEQDVGAGFSSSELGLQLRYELTRKFAPYFNCQYERLFGETSSIAQREGDDNDDLVFSLGLRLMF